MLKDIDSQESGQDDLWPPVIYYEKYKEFTPRVYISQFRLFPKRGKLGTDDLEA